MTRQWGVTHSDHQGVTRLQGELPPCSPSRLLDVVLCGQFGCGSRHSLVIMGVVDLCVSLKILLTEALVCGGLHITFLEASGLPSLGPSPAPHDLNTRVCPLPVCRRHPCTKWNVVLASHSQPVCFRLRYTCMMSNTLGKEQGTSVVSVQALLRDGDEPEGVGDDTSTTTTGIIIIVVSGRGGSGVGWSRAGRD